MGAPGAMASRATSPTPMSPDSTRPPSRSDRQLRFADVTTKDVHVYESQPPSPRKKPLALMSPTEADGATISLGEFNGKLLDSSEKQEERLGSPIVVDPLDERSPDEAQVTEGTPEDIRRRFFLDLLNHAAPTTSNHRVQLVVNLAKVRL